MEKRNRTFYNNGTMSYLQYRAFFFQPDKSKGEENDEIYTLNPVLLVCMPISSYYKNLGRRECFLMNIFETDNGTSRKRHGATVYRPVHHRNLVDAVQHDFDAKD